jgi:Fur family transcriptional regulator, iron response regulator
MDSAIYASALIDDASELVAEGAVHLNSLPGRLAEAGLRPTRQRVLLGELLFGKGDRHVTAETLFEEATAAQMPVSLATVYNTLHQFTAAGLLRKIAVDGARVYFDTNTSEHHHFFLEDRETLYDIPGSVGVVNLPAPPDGLKVARVDVVVRLRREEP